jgi:S-adenosylmethionine decarboxylase
MTESSDNTEKVIPHGQHLIADMFGVDDEKLKDPAFFSRLLKEVATVARLTINGDAQITATAEGCHGFLMLDKAHITIFSVAAAGYLAIDIFLYGNSEPDAMFAAVKAAFPSQMVRQTTITRGLQN